MKTSECHLLRPDKESFDLRKRLKRSLCTKFRSLAQIATFYKGPVLRGKNSIDLDNYD